ncbi:MAG: sensor histidine kinase, partial [Turicibacter sp.]
CIKSYITILNIRYDNKIKLDCHIEEDLMTLSVLKLILQPIIENAVYHGIRQMSGIGEISIEGYRDDEDIIFVIKDNGVGMTDEKIKMVLANELQSEQGGFGLYSCMKRISIFYGIDHPMTIVSELDWGTEITIRLKVIGE